MSWSFGDPTGWAIACLFFVAFSSVIGGGIYGLSHRFPCMGSLGESHAVSRRFNLTTGFLFAVGTFLALYFNTLSGFLTLELHDGRITLQYILPEPTVVLPVIDVLHIEEEPAYRARWRLVLSTEKGGTYERALAARSDVQGAGTSRKQQLAHPDPFSA